jgi:hypothetical protein
MCVYVCACLRASGIYIFPPNVVIAVVDVVAAQTDYKNLFILLVIKWATRVTFKCGVNREREREKEMGKLITCAVSLRIIMQFFCFLILCMHI